MTGLILGGIAFNVWWYWRDTRPVADLRMIEIWIGNREYGLARKELREHLRRAPHDGAARMMLARVLAARGDLAGCTRELHQVPTWWPQKAEALYREGQAYLLLNRARDAEAALLAVIGADLLHPADPAVFHDASQELLSLYATENRWDDAHVILWKVYDRATPAYRPTVLAMRIQSELERIAPTESVRLLCGATWPPIPRTGRHGAPWPTPSWRWASTPRPSATCETAWMPGPRTPASGATT